MKPSDPGVLLRQYGAAHRQVASIRRHGLCAIALCGAMLVSVRQARAQCTASVVNSNSCSDSSLEYISRVQLATVNNASTCNTGTQGYENYTALSANLTLGAPTPITVTIGQPYPGDTCSVFVDWNNSNAFDPSERFDLSPSSLPVGQNTFTGMITAPGGAAAGPLRLRVRLAFAETPQPCGPSSYGNIEDYTVTVGPPPNPVGAGYANPSTLLQNQSTLLTVVVTGAANPPSTGLAVSANLTSIGGSASQSFYDDATHGDATTGDNVFSLQYVIPQSTPLGDKTIPFTVSDAQSRSSAGSIMLSIAVPCSGPDVTVFNLIDVANYGSVGNITAYAVGTDACNPGCQPALWVSNTDQHPVVAQNMYRLLNGRFEQIGQSWLKHTFLSTNSPGCGSCQTPPMGGSQLGVGCTDAYGSGLNGQQGNLGPRSQVNATTGGFPYPFTAPPFSTAIDRRLQVLTADVTPAQNPGARYFVECQYVTADDAAAGNGLNNSTYREVTANTLQSGAPGFAGPSHWRSPAIQAWQDADSSVTVVPVDYVDAGITARFYVGGKATNNGNGTWHYEYAIQNLNSDRSGGSVSIPIDPAVTTSNAGTHATFSHSGEPYSNAAWTSSLSGGVLTFATQAFSVNANANAIRWGTLYNVRFDADVPPSLGSATLGLFKPGAPAALTVSGIPVPGLPCPSNPDGDMNRDGGTDGLDIQGFVTALLSGSSAPADTCVADFNHNGSVDLADAAIFMNVLMGS